jgi:hypothetical protein
MGVSQKMDGLFHGKSEKNIWIHMDDFGVPPMTQETSISGTGLLEVPTFLLKFT